MAGDGSVRDGLTRRDALKVGAGAAGGLAIAGGLLGRGLDAMAAPAVIGDGPYGPLQAPDANGMMLPAGFTSREIARTGKAVVPGGKAFHALPDGMGTYKTADGGFILATNSEMPYLAGIAETGTAAIRFDKNFKPVDYYDILTGTSLNCAGGVTPWGTWLSCEEVGNSSTLGSGGAVWECDPTGVKPQVKRPKMGLFKHEATSIDPVGKVAYLTEDLGDGCLYKFTPRSYPDLSDGKLEAALVDEVDGKVTWLPINDPENLRGIAPRDQQPTASRFKRAEGMWYDEGVIYFATTQDDRVYALHCAEQELEVIYDGVALGEDAPLNDTDNVTVAAPSGDLFVCEDAGDLQVCVISTEGEVAPFLQLPGETHMNSELTGPVFDPSGKRFYFASQRAGAPISAGVVYEVTGPFRRTRPETPGPDPDPKDTKKPALKVRTLGKPNLRGLLKRGQVFKLEIADESPPVEVEIKLVTKLRRAVGKGKREVTIGRLSTRASKSGNKRVRVKVGRKFKERLRRRDVAQTRLVVVATDQEGNRTKVVKRVRFS
ncbi:MAG: alkaline phosphatase PhoX [Solirubrobacterales bacterium]